MLPSFTDSKGTVWQVQITGGAILRARKEEVPLQEALAVKANLPEFIADPFKFIATLALLCQPEMKQISAEEFAERLDGQALNGAAIAFLEAVVDFSQPSVAAMARKALRAAIQTKEAQMSTAISLKLEELASSNYSFEPPEPPASQIPDPGLSAN